MVLDDQYTNKFAPLDSTTIYPKPGHQLLYTPMTGEMKCPTNIPLPCAVHSISFDVDATHAPTLINMIHFISSHDHIGSSILTLLAFHHCLGPLAPSPRLALHSCNRSVKPSLVLIFSTLVTWVHVMSHMQWVPSSHVWALQHIQAISTSIACVAHTSVPMN